MSGILQASPPERFTSMLLRTHGGRGGAGGGAVGCAESAGDEKEEETVDHQDGGQLRAGTQLTTGGERREVQS